MVMQPCVINECMKCNLLLTLLSVGYFGSFKEKYDGIVGPSRWNDALNCKHQIRRKQPPVHKTVFEKARQIEILRFNNLCIRLQQVLEQCNFWFQSYVVQIAKP